MPGPLVNLGTLVQCVHMGPAVPLKPSTRVRAASLPAWTTAGPFQVLCPATPPCAQVQWQSAAMRIKSQGQPIILSDSVATCLSNGTPLKISAATTQKRVKGI